MHFLWACRAEKGEWVWRRAQIRNTDSFHRAVATNTGHPEPVSDDTVCSTIFTDSHLSAIVVIHFTSK